MRGDMEMMKKKTIRMNAMVTAGLLLGLAACGSRQDMLEGKYLHIDSPAYFKFTEDETFETNTYHGILKDEVHTGTYQLEGDHLTMMMDGEVDLDAYVYKDYICHLWEGELPETYEDTEVFYKYKETDPAFYATTSTYAFKEDGTFQYIDEEDIGFGNETSRTINGTYQIEDGKVIITNNKEEGSDYTATFFTDHGRVFSIIFVKEE